MKTNNKIFIAILFALPFIFFSCKKDLGEEFKDTGEQDLALSADVNSVELDVASPDGRAIKFSWTRGSNKGTNAGITYEFQLAQAGTDFQNSFSVNLEKGANTIEYTHDKFNTILTESLGVGFDTDAELEARIIATVHSDGMQPQVSETLNIYVKTYKPITKTLYLIGPATEGGWSANDATPMNVVAGAAGGFTWQGRLNAGELKFITTLGEFLPSYNRGASNQELYLREKGDDPDDKFNIPASGVYQITLNIITKVIHIEAKEAPEFGELWLVGGFTGWNFEPMRNDLLDPFVFHFNAELISPQANPTEEFKIATVQGSFDSDKVFLRPKINGQGAGTNLDVVKLTGDESPEDNKWKIAPGVYKIKLDLRTMKIDIVKFTPSMTMYIVGDVVPSGWIIGNATPMTPVTGNPYKFTWTGALTTSGGNEMKFSLDKKSDWSGAFFVASSSAKQPSGAEEPMLFSPVGSEPDNKWKISNFGNYTIELDQLQETVKFTKQ